MSTLIELLRSPYIPDIQREAADRIESLQAQLAALKVALAQYKKSALTRRVFSLYERITELEADNKRLVDKNLEWLDAWNTHEAQVAALKVALENAEDYLWDASDSSQWEDYINGVPNLESEYTKEEKT